MSCVSPSQTDSVHHSASIDALGLCSLNASGLEAAHQSAERVGGSFFRNQVLRHLRKISQRGSSQWVVRQGASLWHFGQPTLEQTPLQITVRHPRFYRRLALGGSLGAAQSYIDGDWDVTDLCRLFIDLARHLDATSHLEGFATIARPWRTTVNWFRRNNRLGSRRNISAHYDLSNQFFAQMLDPSMTYSSGIFTNEHTSLADAQFEKYDRICRKLRIGPEDHVLEIGTGWGGFALHAARKYGCRVTTTTISAQQYQYANSKIREAGLEGQIRLISQDYRDLIGQYDKLVSIEMIEAVGHQYLDRYFAKCSQLLKPQGVMCLQAITLPDHRFQSYLRSVDFIQRYIFPGGCLPSLGAIAGAVSRVTDLRWLHCEDFGTHYATTLNHWRKNFWERIDQVRALGFDRQFIRTWEYYLCYCLAGFAERQIGVAQLVLARPQARLEPILVA